MDVSNKERERAAISVNEMPKKAIESKKKKSGRS